MFSQKQLYKVLAFPKHLQVSLTSLLKLGLASADQVASVTGKARAVESSYLNQLALMQIVKKEHRGRTVFFSVDLEALNW
jgi:hypothetical protein